MTVVRVYNYINMLKFVFGHITVPSSVVDVSLVVVEVVFSTALRRSAAHPTFLCVAVSSICFHESIGVEYFTVKILDSMWRGCVVVGRLFLTCVRRACV